MKKAILTAMVVAMTAMTAKASVTCIVQAESKPNQFDKTLVLKSFDFSDKSQVIYEESGISYAVEYKANGDLAVDAYKMADRKIFGVAYAKNPEALVLMLPDLHRAVSCAVIKQTSP